MDDKINYYPISREEWRGFYRDGKALLTAEELEHIKSLNDRISLQDVQDIYIPLTHLIHLYMKEFESLTLSKGLFLHEYVQAPPFIVGIAGSVAVGKSTTARLLHTIFGRMFKEKSVELITTDGFLYPNHVLKQKGILGRKGFPESYDMKKLIAFLNEVKSGKETIKAPLYSHDTYDVIENEYNLIQQPDILIVEGINTLQLPANQQIYVSDFFDFSIYVDADPRLIEQWYLERFEALLNTAFRNPDNYYYSYAVGDRKEAFAMAKNVWKTINLKNLNEYILPTRGRADIILHKTTNHSIDEIFLRKY
ncbi:type I pantothenate kinase [Melissococcus plutonius]|uniref:Pantothenate kinase n=1 Tax=Melissococcus plutonius (strain ATCC 35311 / DSM 29964 / CIP 104052 / LMG 20360 / NCIMB 702443) TaxID=940190 RepID=F3Y894_MELPT|nr:type I pantothenate kinase [Melissococcus plutonius]KMT30697.1 pantothenate kinase CoaA [Melissococcus plutonius]KMT35322.1 pantothenate kinase CoaA [Melissococcus plutonius]KMT41060.1 pantothenate kinase CoaA [Melissococcus plutonius]MBB5177889.1 type I pantothenate kinase [Melissococcus plutonius]BAK20722.1 pantothenate kinase [Melissococcus plutonius ATCC 35311]